MEQQKISKKALKISLLLLLTAGLVISFLPYGAAASWHKIFSFFGLADFSAIADSSPLSVHVIDVGKADSIFIECGGKTMLVDGGTADRGEPVAEYLNRRGVKKLDYVVNTHPDDDHIGGLAEILRQYPVSQYFAPKLPAALIPAGEAYRNVQQELKKEKLSATVPKQGASFLLGEAKVSILAPVKIGESTNNNSIILRITFGNTNFLLMGDAQKEEESDLLQSGAELSANVLKVGHHGSSTSTTEAFLKAVKPKYAVISVADDTSGLPKKDTLKRLDAAGAKVYRTDISGTVIFLSDGSNITAVTEKN
jgi:Predicted hydrolase (metallo-beta-lactamase superfamily)